MPPKQMPNESADNGDESTVDPQVASAAKPAAKAAVKAKAKAGPKAAAKAAAKSEPGPKASAKPKAKGAPKAAPKAKRRDSAIVAAEIWQILEKHGVSPLSQSSLDIEDVLGAGQFKQVKKGVLRTETDGEQTCKSVVVLCYSREECDSHEITLLSMLADYPSSSKYIPEVFGHCHERSNTIIVQELAEYGTLKDVVVKHEDTVTAHHKVRAAARLARAMDFLGSARLVHADLSCRNVLVHHIDADPRSFVVKVSDFGLAIQLPTDVDSEIKQQARATRWCAPETVLSFEWSFASDVWSYGVTLWEMCAKGGQPWTNRPKRASVDARLRDLAQTGGKEEGGPDVSPDFPIQKNCSQAMHQALLECFVVEREKRPTFAQVAERFESIFTAEYGPEPEEEKEQQVEAVAVAIPETESKEIEPTSPTTGASISTTSEDSCGKKRDRPHFSLSDLRCFLWSDYAVEALGFDACKAMQDEFESALQKQECFVSLIAEQSAEAGVEGNEGQQSAPGSEYACEADMVPNQVEGMFDGEVRNETHPDSDRLVLTQHISETRGSEARGSEARCGADPLGSAVTMCDKATQYEDNLLPDTGETSVKPDGMSSADLASPALSMVASSSWMVWSITEYNQLQQQKFANECDAMAAFHAIQRGPCVLRDPLGRDVLSRSWVLVGTIFSQ